MHDMEIITLKNKAKQIWVNKCWGKHVSSCFSISLASKVNHYQAAKQGSRRGRTLRERHDPVQWHSHVRRTGGKSSAHHTRGIFEFGLLDVRQSHCQVWSLQSGNHQRLLFGLCHCLEVFSESHFMNSKVQNLLSCLAVFGHFLDPPGNHPRGAIFPTVD